MKKRALAWLLTLALCLGLTVPASAADASGLDANGAKAFYDTLAGYKQAVPYAGLRDLDKDNVPELVVVSCKWPDGDGPDYHTATIDIWQAKNGKAVRVANTEFDAAQACSMRYATRTGSNKTFICVSSMTGRERLAYGASDFITIGGVYESLSFYADYGLIDPEGDLSYSYTIAGKTYSITEAQYEQYGSAYTTGEYFLDGGGDSWRWDNDYLKKNDASYQETLKLLAQKANSSASPAPAAGTYGPYKITGITYDGTPYTISFSAAKVEQKTVQMREHYDIDDSYSAYESTKVTLVAIRPDTVVSISGGVTEGDHRNLVPVAIGHFGEDNKFTREVFGVVEYIQSGVGRKSFEWDLNPDFVLLNDYLIYEDASSVQGGFADVKAGAYYEDAVKWAVDKKITSGTSATSFSPNNTCTVGQILTFLWRANGSPAPSIKNPFTDSIPASFQNAAIWAYQKGLVSGKTFGANNPCTRAMAVTYLWKLAGSPSEAAAYQPQTISGVYDGKNVTVSFSAALKEETSVIKRPYEDYNHPVSSKVTLITLQPESQITVQGVPCIYTRPYDVENDGTYSDPGPQGAVELETGTAGNPKNISDLMAIETMDFTDRNGNPYMIVVRPSSGSTSFTDVPANSTYAQAVAWAVKQGITSGATATTFNPNGTCTRGQIVTFLYRAMK